MKAFVLKYRAFVPITALCFFYVWKAIDFPLHDFSNYYFGGHFFANGNFGSWIYFPYEFNTAIAATGQSGIFASYAPNTPFLAFVFAPLSYLPIASAKLVFNLFSALLFLYSLKRLVSFYKIDSIYVLLLPFLFFVPIKNELLFGQVYFLLFFLLSESWLAYERRQLFKMSVLLALAILLKVFPMLIILVFIFQKQWRGLLYVGISTGILSLASIAFNGIEIWFFYFQDVLSKASNGEISEAFVVNYQSVVMFLKQLLVFDKTQNPAAFFNYPILFAALIVAFKAKLMAIGFYLTRRANNSLFVISYWIIAMILLSPYGSTYTFILLVFAYFSLAKSPLSKGKKLIGCTLLFVISNIPLAVFSSAVFPICYLRLLTVVLFFIWFISWFWYAIDIKIVSLITLIPLLLVLLLKKDVAKIQQYVLAKDSPILIYDYKIENNQLTYFYWNENGSNTTTIPFAGKELRTVIIKNNRIDYNGKRLLYDSNNMFKPTAVAGNGIIYLSDADRGIGFYTLRKIALP